MQAEVQRIHLRDLLLAVGTCHCCLGVLGLAPLHVSLLIKLQAAFCFSRTRTNTNIQSQPEQLQRACHEPVCYVPESMDKHLPVPDCSLQRASIHILGAYLLI